MHFECCTVDKDDLDTFLTIRKIDQFDIVCIIDKVYYNIFFSLNIKSLNLIKILKKVKDLFLLKKLIQKFKSIF